MTDEAAVGWLDPLYARAAGDPARVPWARLAPSPHLLALLDTPGLDVADVDAIVVGCGLGDDAVELARRGCRVRAFDVSPTAVEWARRRSPDGLRIRFEVADLLDLPDDLVGSGGLVVEIRTVQSLPERVRPDALRAVAALVAPGGYLLHAGLLATSPAAAQRFGGPPFALAPEELRAYDAAGLQRLEVAHPAHVEGDAYEARLLLRRAA